ncbi:hypothetical protein [Sinorhizobium fredii]|nr:hypothetical protein [Sinorhizobium fredii]
MPLVLAATIPSLVRSENQQALEMGNRAEHVKISSPAAASESGDGERHWL